MAGYIAQKILKSLSTPFHIDGHEHLISASVGISIFPSDGEDMHTLMINADGAMYYAKNMGRANYQFFTPEMNHAAHERLELETSLRQAISHNELELHYQPMFRMGTGEITAMEALVRWRHPRKGLVGPAEFIPLAEENGVIIPLGAWVLREACRQNWQWQQAGFPALRVAVNISALQFRQESLAETIWQILDETGLDATSLELEVTESVVMEDAEYTAGVLEELHSEGVTISIDDFGTGYSSLNCLKHFRIDKLKIDRACIRDIASNPGDAAVVNSVTALAHSLNLEVIAEGVETEEQLHLVMSYGCDEYQGFYGSYPLPPPEFEWLLQGSCELASSASG